MQSESSNDREETVCGFFKERFYFWMWNLAAPSPDPNRVANRKNIEATPFTTADNKRLNGYKYHAHTENGERIKPKGYVLMAMGNAMASDIMIEELRSFAENGFDVYVYDYRGYGNSEGKRRLKAIVADYQEIVSDLNKKYPRKLLYGVSFGGIVLMNVIGSGVDYDAAVIDSSPSRLSPHGCQKQYDTVEHIPNDASKIFVITGKQDTVIDENMSRELYETAEKNGAKVYQGENFDHPFLDASHAVRSERMRLIQEFLFNR